MPIKSVFDQAKFDRIAHSQREVVSRAQALSTGMSRSAIGHMLRDGGPWQKIVPGVYATTTGAITPDQRAVAALLHAGPRSVITGPAAVRRHRLTCAGLNEIDVLIPREVRIQSTGFVHIVHTSRMPRFHMTGPIRFAELPRAVCDAARAMARPGDVRAVVAEAIQRGRCDLASLINETNSGPSRGSRLLRLALGEVRDGVRSAAEADLRSLIEHSDVEKPMYNPALYTADGEFLGIADAWWQRAGVAAEIDSRQYHFFGESYERTLLRHNKVTAHAISVLHIPPGSLKREPSAILRDIRKSVENGNMRPPLPIVAIPVEFHERARYAPAQPLADPNARLPREGSATGGSPSARLGSL